MIYKKNYLKEKLLKISLITLLVISAKSCISDKEKALISDCDGLSMMFYRGLPKPSKLYKKHCESKLKDLEYTPQLCKRAMSDFMLNGDRKRLAKMFGSRIMECFNEADIKRFEK